MRYSALALAVAAAVQQAAAHGYVPQIKIGSVRFPLVESAIQKT